MHTLIRTLACIGLLSGPNALLGGSPQPWRISLGAGAGTYQLRFDELLSLPYADPRTGRTVSASRGGAFTDVGKVPFNVSGKDKLRLFSLRVNKGPWTMGGVYQDKRAEFNEPPGELPVENIRGNLHNSSRFGFVEYRFFRERNTRPFARFSGGYSRSRYAYKDILTYMDNLNEPLYHAYLNLDSHFRISSATAGIEFRGNAISIAPYYRYDFVSFVSNLHTAPSYRLPSAAFAPAAGALYADAGRGAGTVDATTHQGRQDHVLGLGLGWSPVRRLRLRLGVSRNVTAHRWNGEAAAIWMFNENLGMALGLNYSEFTVFNALSRSAWAGPVASFKL